MRHAAVAVMHKPAPQGLFSITERLLERVEGRVALQRVRYAPPHDPA